MQGTVIPPGTDCKAKAILLIHSVPDNFDPWQKVKGKRRKDQRRKKKETKKRKEIKKRKKSKTNMQLWKRLKWWGGHFPFEGAQAGGSWSKGRLGILSAHFMHWSIVSCELHTSLTGHLHIILLRHHRSLCIGLLYLSSGYVDWLHLGLDTI